MVDEPLSIRIADHEPLGKGMVPKIQSDLSLSSKNATLTGRKTREFVVKKRFERRESGVCPCRVENRRVAYAGRLEMTWTVQSKLLEKSAGRPMIRSF